MQEGALRPVLAPTARAIYRTLKFGLQDNKNAAAAKVVDG